MALLRNLEAGVAYFALVFGVGFVLGVVRTVWIAPSPGLRAAELAEMPVMFMVIVLAARWVVRGARLPRARGIRLGVGILALVLLLGSELALALWVRGVPIREYFAARDPVTGTVYLVMLGVFALMPVCGRLKMTSPGRANGMGQDWLVTVPCAAQKRSRESKMWPGSFRDRCVNITDGAYRQSAHRITRCVLVGPAILMLDHHILG